VPRLQRRRATSYSRQATGSSGVPPAGTEDCRKARILFGRIQVVPWSRQVGDDGGARGRGGGAAAKRAGVCAVLRGRCHRPRTDGTECSFPFHQRALPHTRNRRGRATSRALSRGGQSGFGKGGWRHLLACSQPLHECATSRGAVHLHPLCGIPFPLLCSCIPPRPMASVTDFTTPAYRLAQVEPHSLARHARGLKRPRGRCALCSTCCATTRQQ